MKNLLVVTTSVDRSLPLFFSQSIQNVFDTTVLLYKGSEEFFLKKIEGTTFDVVYYRDPFTEHSLDRQTLKQTIEFLLEHVRSLQNVDQIKSVEDFFIEDKWKQYQIYKQFMPLTKEIEDKSEVDQADWICKKRISSRGQDIHFSSQSLPSNFQKDEYIIQKKLDLVKEYRVNVFHGHIHETVLTKQSKQEGIPVLISGSEPLSDPLREFVQSLLTICTYDLVGFDVAEDSQGKFMLIEANRSPQVEKTYVYTQVNLMEKLLL